MRQSIFKYNISILILSLIFSLMFHQLIAQISIDLEMRFSYIDGNDCVFINTNFKINSSFQKSLRNEDLFKLCRFNGKY